jgi:hypothetical protein
MAVFWVVAPLCSLVEVYQRFRGPCCLHHQGADGGSSNYLWKSVKFYLIVPWVTSQGARARMCVCVCVCVCMILIIASRIFTKPCIKIILLVTIHMCTLKFFSSINLPTLFHCKFLRWERHSDWQIIFIPRLIWPPINNHMEQGFLRSW